MHVHQGEKPRVEKETDSSGERPEPEDTSQKTEVWRKGMETTEREELESMACTEGQADWRAGRAEKSKPGVEDSRLTACRTG